MAKRPPPPKPIIVQTFTRESALAGIKKLERRKTEISALATTHYDGQEKRNAISNVVATIREVFGPDSAEADENKYFSIWQGGHNMMDSEQRSQQKFLAGIPEAIKALDGLIARIREKVEDLEESPKFRATEAFGNAGYHQICLMAEPTFRDGHYQNAVFEASKALVNLVKSKAKKFDKDGAALMHEVFSRKNPILAFSKLETQSEQDEQEGMMHMFVGFVLAIRNPRGHEAPEDSPERALEYLSIISFLANALERTSLRQQ